MVMKQSGIHIPHNMEILEPFAKSAEIVWAMMSMIAPPRANAIVSRVTVRSLRLANRAIVSSAGFFNGLVC